MKRLERIKRLVPLKPEPPDFAFAKKHLAEEKLYTAGNPRFICSLLGAIYEEVSDRPEIQELVLEAAWMADRMGRKLTKLNGRE